MGGDPAGTPALDVDDRRQPAVGPSRRLDVVEEMVRLLGAVERVVEEVVRAGQDAGLAGALDVDLEHRVAERGVLGRLDEHERATRVEHVGVVDVAVVMADVDASDASPAAPARPLDRGSVDRWDDHGVVGRDRRLGDGSAWATSAPLDASSAVVPCPSSESGGSSSPAEPSGVGEASGVNDGTGVALRRRPGWGGWVAGEARTAEGCPRRWRNRVRVRPARSRGLPRPGRPGLRPLRLRHPARAQDRPPAAQAGASRR